MLDSSKHVDLEMGCDTMRKQSGVDSEEEASTSPNADDITHQDVESAAAKVLKVQRAVRFRIQRRKVGVKCPGVFFVLFVRRNHDAHASQEDLQQWTDVPSPEELYRAVFLRLTLLPGNALDRRLDSVAKAFHDSSAGSVLYTR